LRNSADLRPAATLMQAALENAGAFEPRNAMNFLGALDAAGAPTGLLRKVMRREGDADTVPQAKRFTPWLQLRDNASRIRQVGGNWLADWMKPLEGVGYYEIEH